MATTALVDRDLEVGRMALAALTKAGIAVNMAFWAYVPQLSEWQLFIATPLVDSKGLRSAYDQVLRTLQSEGIDTDLPWRRIFLRSPKDTVLKSLEKKSKGANQEVFRVVNEEIAGNFVEDAYVYGGSLFIVKAGNSRPNPSEHYSVMYTPRSGPRPPAPPLRMTIEEVRQFLKGDLRMDQHTVDPQIAKLRAGQSALIPVSLTPAQLTSLGLA
jgi:hypothetical protein